MKPTTYLGWLRATAVGCLLGWRLVPEHARDAWRSFSECVSDASLLLFMLVLPLLTPFAPIIALVLSREHRLQEERRSARAKDCRDEFTKHSQREDS